MAEIAQKQQGRTRTASNSIVMLILSIVLLIVGIALMANPAGGLEVVMLIVGIVMIVYGAITIFMDMTNKARSARLFVLPILMIIAGILLIAFRGPVANVLLPLILGIWAIVYGIINLVNSNRVKREGGYWQASFILALITLALGIIMLVAMIAGGNAVGVIIGVILTIFAIVSIVQWFIGRAATRNAQ